MIKYLRQILALCVSRSGVSSSEVNSQIELTIDSYILWIGSDEVRVPSVLLSD